uniref:TNF superfamily member 14 n=1 Tax=Nothobranchius furzeri TaxID=105023 RepID=A0A8C6PWW1_NOTFU
MSLGNTGGCPSVFVVDTHATRPPVPPRLMREGRWTGAPVTLLTMLVSLALCGMVIEACFIYSLYQTELVNVAFSYCDEVATIENHLEESLPSKPMAHLTDGVDVVHEKQIMGWSMNADPILYEMVYRNGSLIIQKEGYYFIYSKVYFSFSGIFHHLINMKTEKYTGKFITLLQSRETSPESSKMRSNSYLGGVFHLSENDAIYVSVSSTQKILRHKSFENVFGAYMI